ncbi:MAG: hypothetical protein U9R34_08135 [Nanoarchaeota archaeon]|nr:hypothetical protein [Nanoarchaeota archaeon]
MSNTIYLLRGTIHCLFKMEIFIFDANVPIALDTSGHFSILKDIFEDNDNKIIMSKDNFEECRKKYDYKLCRKLQGISCFEIETNIDQEKLKDIKITCEKKLKQKMHQDPRKSTDYQVILMAIEKNADFLVTNDRKLFQVFEKYQQYINTPEIRKIKPLTMALFLRYLQNLNKEIFTPLQTANINFDIYEKVETPNFCQGVKTMGWEYNDVQKVFRPYARNVISIINN